MSEQTKQLREINARQIQKHDIEKNWHSDKFINFVPMKGEFIIYDRDLEHDVPRLKIGDGSTRLIDLPFSAENLGIKGDAEKSLVFNDLINNKTLSPYGTTFGYNNISGMKGFEILRQEAIPDNPNQIQIYLKDMYNPNIYQLSYLPRVNGELPPIDQYIMCKPKRQRLDKGQSFSMKLRLHFAYGEGENNVKKESIGLFFIGDNKEVIIPKDILAQGVTTAKLIVKVAYDQIIVYQYTGLNEYGKDNWETIPYMISNSVNLFDPQDNNSSRGIDTTLIYDNINKKLIIQGKVWNEKYFGENGTIELLSNPLEYCSEHNLWLGSGFFNYKADIGSFILNQTQTYTFENYFGWNHRYFWGLGNQKYPNDKYHYNLTSDKNSFITTSSINTISANNISEEEIIKYKAEPEVYEIIANDDKISYTVNIKDTYLSNNNTEINDAKLAQYYEYQMFDDLADKFEFYIYNGIANYYDKFIFEADYNTARSCWINAFYRGHLQVSQTEPAFSETDGQVVESIETVQPNAWENAIVNLINPSQITPTNRFRVAEYDEIAKFLIIEDIEEKSFQFNGSQVNFAPGNLITYLVVKDYPLAGEAISYTANSLVSGEYNRGTGRSSIVGGKQNIQYNDYGLTIGIQNTGGYGAIAFGQQNLANGLNSIVGGKNSKTIGINSVAIGEGLIANNDNMAVFGKYNKTDEDREDNVSAIMFTIGNGSGENERSNAFWVDALGNAKLAGKLTVKSDDNSIQNDGDVITKHYLTTYTNNTFTTPLKNYGLFGEAHWLVEPPEAEGAVSTKDDKKKYYSEGQIKDYKTAVEEALNGLTTPGFYKFGISNALSDEDSGSTGTFEFGGQDSDDWWVVVDGFDKENCRQTLIALQEKYHMEVSRFRFQGNWQEWIVNENFMLMPVLEEQANATIKSPSSADTTKYGEVSNFVTSKTYLYKFANYRKYYKQRFTGLITYNNNYKANTLTRFVLYKAPSGKDVDIEEIVGQTYIVNTDNKKQRYMLPHQGVADQAYVVTGTENNSSVVYLYLNSTKAPSGWNNYRFDIVISYREPI